MVILISLPHIGAQSTNFQRCFLVETVAECRHIKGSLTVLTTIGIASASETRCAHRIHSDRPRRYLTGILND